MSYLRIQPLAVKRPGEDGEDQNAHKEARTDETVTLRTADGVSIEVSRDIAK